MRVPLSWLRDFAPIEASPDALAGVLNELGLVVDAVERVGAGLEDVVVARVAEIRAIPGADRIRQVVVDAGGDALDVVCGAWNFSVGDLVPLAPVGTLLPGASEPIARRKMRGVVSNGMLCSGVELGLSEDAAGLLILPTGLEPGAPFAEAMGISSDVVFELDITPNRPDAMSVAGVARDVAAALKLPFSIPDLALAEEGPPASGLATVVVEDPDLCPLFVARVLTDVEVGESPDWVARRLTLAGMRPINSVVDASNYVMLELGQPSHPYDLDRLAGGGLSVRAARPGETVTTLDGVERPVGTGPGSDCLICDAEGAPVGLAGIMGGESSEISGKTRRVLVEVAHFSAMGVARTSKRLGLRTEASARFERGTDPEAVELAAARVCALAAGAADGPAEAATDGTTPGRARVAPGALVAGGVPPRPRLTVRTGRVNRILGTSLEPGQVAGYLEPLGFRPAPGGDVIEVEVPGFRPDVTAEIDLIEEVARHHGYGRIPRTVPATPEVGALTPAQRERRLVREVLVGAGLSEAWTPSLLPPGAHAEVGLDGPEIELANPMSRDEAVLRRSLLPGLLRAVRYNAGHRNTGIRLFEVGRVFEPRPGESLPAESEMVAAALYSGGDAASATVLWRTLAEALRLESPTLLAGRHPGLHPTRTAQARAGAVALGWVGEVDPGVLGRFDLTGRLGWVELDLAALASAPRRPLAVRPVSIYPSSDVDLAFVVPEAVPAGEVEATLRDAAGDLLVGLWLFDVFRDPSLTGAEARSLAWRLRFCASDRTLNDSEVAEIRSRCIGAVEKAHGATLRG